MPQQQVEWVGSEEVPRKGPSVPRKGLLLEEFFGKVSRRGEEEKKNESVGRDSEVEASGEPEHRTGLESQKQVDRPEERVEGGKGHKGRGGGGQ